ncbi:MAG: antibiotic biosynthesis monooxygenase [Gammaproteobacteria bacterium]|jgi:quinol monooxygenase YgiN|nr:antibiotic biosynthesis monooxygenase [Gammaproteobacteria bacterium]MDP6080025.1 putative quinol monooxygenase [Arenicellales bacterium]
MIGAIAELEIKDGKQEEFEAVFAALATEVSDKEGGNKLYQLTRSRADATVYKVMELYVDQAALDAHGQSDHFKEASQKMGVCMGGAPKIEIVDAV